MNLTLNENVVDLDFESEDTLLSSVLISLFLDARASDEEFEEVKDSESSKRGYWGEQLDGHKYGSKLWLLKRCPKNQETLEKAKAYVVEALNWLIEDGLAESLGVETKYEEDTMLIAIEINNELIRVSYRG